MKRLRYWLVALLVVVIPVTGMAAAGVACCKESPGTQASVAHEHHMHHHDVSAEAGSKLASHASCHCAHCAMGCGSACVTTVVTAIGLDIAGSTLSLNAALSRAVAAHHLDPFRPPIRRA